MKKFLIIVFTIILTAGTMFCLFYFGAFKSCAPKEETQAPPVETTPTTANADFMFELRENESGLLYLNVSGNIYTDFQPKNITFTAFNKESKVNVTKVMLYEGGYVFSFSEKVTNSPAFIKNGDCFIAQLNVEDVKGKKHTTIAKFISTDDYEYTNAVDFESGQNVSGYDKVGVWIGPY